MIHIRSLKVEKSPSVCRVQADIEGYPLWFESSDVPLTAAPEAFASAMLLPALTAKKDIKIEAPLSLLWMKNMSQLFEIFSEWWKYPKIKIQSQGFPEEPPQGPEKTALFFTGGVDSFYSLLRGYSTMDHLVFVHGYDIKLEDQSRMKAFEKSLHAVAAQTNSKPLVVRTNLREHPLFRTLSWARAHGTAIAAVAYVLENQANRFFISSSHAYSYKEPWGSHWRIDEYFSKENLETIPFGAHRLRYEKLEALCSEPLLQDHLRVCYENRTSELNCSQCEKCIRTMLVLEKLEKLHPFSVFTKTAPFPDLLNQAKLCSPNIIPEYEELIARGIEDPRLLKSVKSLIRRSKKASSLLARIQNKLGRMLKLC